MLLVSNGRTNSNFYSKIFLNNLILNLNLTLYILKNANKGCKQTLTLFESKKCLDNRSLREFWSKICQLKFGYYLSYFYVIIGPAISEWILLETSEIETYRKYIK